MNREKQMGTYPTRIKKKNSVAVDNGIQTMSYNKHCERFKLLSYGLLNKSVSPNINSCSCFIKYKNLRTAKQRPSKTKQLPLSNTEIFACLRDLETGKKG